MTRRARGVLAALPLLLLPVAACSGEDSSSPEPAPEPSRPTGNVFEGDGYAFAAPGTWRDATDRFKAVSEAVDLGALESRPRSASFGDNVNVIADPPYPEMSPEEAEQTFAAEVRQQSRKVEIRPRTEIAGHGAVSLSSLTPIGKLEVHTTQFAAYVDDAWYVITFSHAPETPAAERKQDIATVLDSWVWTDDGG